MKYMGPRKQNLIILLILACMMISLLFVAGCSSLTANAGKGAIASPTPNSTFTVERVEVMHFHPAQQCYSCKTLGEYAKETVNIFFVPELESGSATRKAVIRIAIKKATLSIQGVPIPACVTGNSLVRSPEDNVER